ncbi:hypothetical protein LCGC14_2897850, partial [marine sediment metagenome]
IGLGDAHHIWTGVRGPLTLTGLKQATQHILTQIGVAGGPHMLRHTFAREWLRNGGDLRSLQDLLGHTDIKTTVLYTALNDTDLQLKHAQFSPVARAQPRAM